VSGSGISWAICKSVPRSRKITMPAPHHSVFLQAECPSCHPTNSVKALNCLNLFHPIRIMVSACHLNKQESLANAKVNAQQHCVSLSCLCNSLIQIEWVVQLLLPPKHAKSRKILREFDLTAVQGHPRSSILVSIESPCVTSH